MARSKLLWVLAAFAAVLTAGAAASAADQAPPLWRGEAGSTFQQWDFTTDADPAAPELVSNSYGSPSADITVGEFGAGWQYQLPGMGTLTGYWDLGGTGGTISIDIANEAVPGAYKEVWIQVTYFWDITAAPLVDVGGGVLVDGQTLTVEDVDTGGSWMVDQSLWRIDPSPASEIVTLTSDAMWGSVVDSVVVDTRNVIPEPATVIAVLMGLGGVLVRRRRA